MSLTPADIAGDVVAVGLAASKLLPVTQPLWAKLPKWVAVLLPVVVLDLPQVLAAFGVVQTGTDLTMAIVTSVALLVPGIAQAEVTTAK